MADPGAGDASPRHSPSELSTVLNTPRAETPEPGPSEPVDTTRFETSPTSSSSTSGERRIEFQPTWPKMIDITRIATVATWKTQRLPGLFLDLHWHIPSRKAFFKLRATLPLTRETGPRNGKTGIYVFIDPERVRQLSIEHDSHETVHGPNTVSLKFVMATPPALVVPNTPYEPKTAAAKQIFDSIRSLASQTCFDVHVKMPSSKLSTNLLEELCAVVSSQDVGSLPTQANAAGLYRGQGGRVIEGDTLVELNTSPPPDEAPPGYCEPPSAPCKYTLPQICAKLGLCSFTFRLRPETASPVQLWVQRGEAIEIDDSLVPTEPVGRKLVLA